MEEELRKLLNERDNLTRRIRRQEYFMNSQLEDMENDFKSYMPSPTTDQEKQFKQLRDEYKDSAEKEINQTKNDLVVTENRIGLEIKKIRDNLLKEETSLKKNINDAKTKLENASKEYDDAEVRKIRQFRYEGIVINDDAKLKAKENAQAEVKKAETALKNYESRMEKISLFFGDKSIQELTSKEILEMLGYEEVSKSSEKAEKPKETEESKVEPVVSTEKPEVIVESNVEPVAENEKPEVAVEPKSEPVVETEKSEVAVEPKIKPVVETEKSEVTAEQGENQKDYYETIQEILQKSRARKEQEESFDIPLEGDYSIDDEYIQTAKNVDLVRVESDLSTGCVTCVYNIDGKEVLVPTSYVDESGYVTKPMELIKVHEGEEEYYKKGIDPYVLHAIYESARCLNIDGYIDEYSIANIQENGINKYSQSLKTTGENYLSNVVDISYKKSEDECIKNMLKYEKKYVRQAKNSSMVDYSEVKEEIKTIFEKAKDFFTGITGKASSLLKGDKKLELPAANKVEIKSKTDEEKIEEFKKKMDEYTKHDTARNVASIGIQRAENTIETYADRESKDHDDGPEL